MISCESTKDSSKLPRARLNDCVDVDHFLDSGTNFSVMSRDLLTKLLSKGAGARKTPLKAFEFGMARSDLTVGSHSMANIDMALETKTWSHPWMFCSVVTKFFSCWE